VKGKALGNSNPQPINWQWMRKSQNRICEKAGKYDFSKQSTLAQQRIWWKVKRMSKLKRMMIRMVMEVKEVVEKQVNGQWNPKEYG
jgi:hypothetical protein